MHAFGVDDEWHSVLCPVPSPVPGVGHFKQALLGHFWKAPKGINPELLGMTRVASEDSVRRGMKSMEEAESG